MVVSNSSQQEAWLRLVLTPGIGPQTVYKLLKAFGSPEAILQASRLLLLSVVPEKVTQALQQGPDNELLEHTLVWAAQPGHHLLCWGDDAYPAQFLSIEAPPPLLYFQGNLALLQAKSLAIVGSRNATPQGKATAKAFAQSLSEARLTIVSGLALGIDTAAHEGGLQGAGSTIGILGTGLDCIYPRQNQGLAERMIAAGGILSEFPLTMPPIPQNFPRRNRLISGLTQGCLVVEASLSSGSLITARLALEQGREVFAIPGSIHSPFSKGCHRLIKEGAKLVESTEDILEELHFPASAVTSAEPLSSHHPSANTEMTPAEALADQILQAMGYDPIDLESICHHSRLSSEIVSAQLLTLELQGKLTVLPGGRYQRS